MVHTEDDVKKLSHQLGLAPDEVRAMLESQGGGGPSSTTRRSAASAPPPKKTRVDDAWGDFVREETQAPAATTSKYKQPQSASSSSSPNPPKEAKKDPPGNAAATNPAGNLAAERKYGPVSPLETGGGLLAQSGILDAEVVGRTKRPASYRPQCYDLETPTLLCPSLFPKRKVSFVAASPSSCHSMCIAGGIAYGWGRNEQSQLGGLPARRTVWTPTPMEVPTTSDLVAAAVGKGHSLLIDADGVGYAAGFNKFGQCAVNTSIETINKWRKIIVGSDVSASPSGNEATAASLGGEIRLAHVACGENFSVALDSAGRLYTAGSGENGCTGAGYTGEYFVAANKIAFSMDMKFTRRSRFVTRQNTGTVAGDSDNGETLPRSSEIRLASISCGRNHTVAVEAECKNGTPRRAFSWGSGAYGCLGHRVQADEYLPRVIDNFSTNIFSKNSPAKASCGSQCSMIITQSGHLYYWGKHKTAGEATMYPTIIDQLANNGHIVATVSGGNQTVVACTNNGVSVSWGNGLHGELGYGKNGAKSSSKPKFIEGIDAVIVRQVLCGYGHTLFFCCRRKMKRTRRLWRKCQ
mmetsp:Transcript_8896/g.19587  ORF Transcript_8896/g.19587 Transcript_8896/m.19587 type:complete len:579 (-) Transcript_8896:275-2011(-)